MNYIPIVGVLAKTFQQLVEERDATESESMNSSASVSNRLTLSKNDFRKLLIVLYTDI